MSVSQAAPVYPSLQTQIYPPPTSSIHSPLPPQGEEPHSLTSVCQCRIIITNISWLVNTFCESEYSRTMPDHPISAEFKMRKFQELRHINNILKMWLIAGISRKTQSKSLICNQELNWLGISEMMHCGIPIYPYTCPIELVLKQQHCSKNKHDLGNYDLQSWSLGVLPLIQLIDCKIWPVWKLNNMKSNIYISILKSKPL